MKKTGWKEARCGLRFLVLTAVLCLVSLWQFLAVRRELPDIIEWYAESGYAYSHEQLQQLSDSTQAGFYVQAQQPVTDEILGNTVEMTVRWADREYLQWSGIQLEAGQWPEEEMPSTQAQPQGADTVAGEAAVSTDWALAHYKFVQVTGQTVQIDGLKYRISGVYKTADSWRQQLAGDGTDVLYVGFQTGRLPEDCCMNYLYFAKEGADFQCNQSYLEDLAASVTGVRTVPDISLDTESVRHVCLQNIVVCGILWLLLAAVCLGSAGLKVPGYLALAVCAVCIVSYQWYIPMPYLPEENVFDFAGYFRQYVQGQNLRHLYHECGYFGNLAFIHVWISWGVSGLELAAAVYVAAAQLVHVFVLGKVGK